MPDEIQWVTLHNPTTGGWHRVPDNPGVIQDFQDRGFLTPEDSAARAEADAGQLRGQELEDALKDVGLSTSGTVKAKQERLAAHRAEQQPAAPEPNEPFDPLTQSNTTTEENEGEQV